jgi:3-methylcrotonyl-CoA carboxylase beta subunit
MSDETIIVRNQGTIFLGGPPLVKAATGEVVSAEDLGGGDVHTRLSGVADHLAENDLHALAHRPRIVGNLNGASRCSWRCSRRAAAVRCGRALRHRDPHRRAQALRRARGHRPHRRRQRVRRVQGALRHHAGDRLRPHLGHAGRHRRQQRHPVRRSAQKGAHFIELCCQRKVPLVFLQNITGFMVGRKYENGGIAKDGAKMVTAVATARCPSSPSSSAAASAPATTACAAAPTARASCGCGPTRASR